MVCLGTFLVFHTARRQTTRDTHKQKSDMKTNTIMKNVQTTQFATEILEGLRAMPKYLPAKYFYDKAGDQIFQEITNCDEYYPFACELEIFRMRTAELAAAIMQTGSPFDLIELGPGDCKKSAYL